MTNRRLGLLAIACALALSGHTSGPAVELTAEGTSYFTDGDLI